MLFEIKRRSPLEVLAACAAPFVGDGTAMAMATLLEMSGGVSVSPSPTPRSVVAEYLLSSCEGIFRQNPPIRPKRSRAASPAHQGRKVPRFTQQIGVGADAGSEECGVCGGSTVDCDDEVLLCDGCEVEVHLTCTGLSSIPEGDWMCRTCTTSHTPLGRQGAGSNGSTTAS